jgi:hypothetical protein
MADDEGRPLLYLSDEEILETKPNSRVILIDKNHRSNRTGKTFQTYCPNNKESTKGAISVVLQYSIWHRLSSKNKDPILGEPIPKVHNYDEDEGTLDVGILNIRTLQEALETSVQQHVAEALQMVEDETQLEQAKDKSQDEQDPINVRIQNSPIRTLPTQAFGRNRATMMTTTQTTTQTTLPSTNPPVLSLALRTRLACMPHGPG